MKLRKIKYKIVVPIILIIVCIGILVLIIDYFRYLKAGEYNYKIMGESILRNTELHLAQHLYLNEVVEIQKVIDNIKKNEVDIVYVFLINNKNKVLVHTFSNGFPEELLSFNTVLQKNEELIEFGNQTVYDFSYPIENGSLGIVRIGLSGEKLDNNIKHHLSYLILIFIIWTFIGVIVALIITSKITTSIEILLNSVNKIARGNLNERVQLNTKDEIQDLAVSINSMANSLQVVKDELEEKIVSLESKNQEIELINVDLNVAKNKAEESNRLKTEFLNNISHEIRTPMNAISGFTSLLLKGDISDEQKKAYYSIINCSTHRLLNIIDDIIYISEINAGIDIFKEEEVNLIELNEKLFRKYIAIANDKNLNLNLLVDKNILSPVIYSDHGKLTKILNSLLDNALKFTVEGEVQFGFEQKNEIIEFYVKDTGIGIAKKDFNEIFEFFKKIKDNTKIINEGIGIGLTIAKAYVKLLGGNFWFTSVPNKGSEFYFSIPAKFKEIENKDKKGINKLADINPEQIILIVEDENANFLYLKELLANVDARIIRAKFGKEAVELFNKNKNIQFILMDIKLPDTDGFTLTKQFKASRPDIPIIAQTAYAMQSDRKKAYEVGCDDYIPKPIVVDDFYNIIKKYCKSVNVD